MVRGAVRLYVSGADADVRLPSGMYLQENLVTLIHVIYWKVIEAIIAGLRQRWHSSAYRLERR